MNGYQGSYVDLFREAERMPGAQQESMFTAVTPEQKEQGLRPLHEAGRTDASMTFSDVPPNTPFNTVGMKAPIDIKEYDKQGHLVKSYESVPPGIQNLDTGPNEGTVLETPARMQSGGRRLKKDALEMFPALEALGNVKVKADKEFTRDLTGIGDIEYFAPGQKAITYPSGARVKHPGSDRRHTVLVNPETNNAQNVALDMLHGLPAEDPEYNRLVQEFGETLGEDDPKHFYELAREEGLAEDGYDQFRQNYIDGKIRNLLFQGSEEDFKKAIYNPEERQQIQEYNPGAYEKFLEIERHLKSPRKKQQVGGYNPGEYMNEMQPKVFPNQKRDAQWVNYTTEHDFAGRFPGETKSNRELGLEISNRNTVPLPPTPTVPKELRTRAQEGTFASDNTRVSMPELQDQEAFNPYSDLHLPPSGRIDYSPVNVEDLLGIGQLIKPSRAVKRYFQKAADEGRNAGIAFRNAQAQKEAVIRNEKIAQRIDQGIDIGYDDIYKPIRAEFQQKLDMGYTNIRANPYGEISRSLQNRFAPLSRGPVNDFKKDINRFLDYHIPSQYRAEQRLFNRKLQRKADDALDEMIKFDRGSRTYLDQIENLYKPSKGGSKSTGSISGPSAKEKLADDFFDRNLDAPGTVQNKRGGYIKLRRKRYK